jgi:hypothetical protein
VAWRKCWRQYRHAHPCATYSLLSPKVCPR